MWRIGIELKRHEGHSIHFLKQFGRSLPIREVGHCRISENRGGGESRIAAGSLRDCCFGVSIEALFDGGLSFRKFPPKQQFATFPKNCFFSGRERLLHRHVTVAWPPP